MVGTSGLFTTPEEATRTISYRRKEEKGAGTTYPSLQPKLARPGGKNVQQKGGLSALCLSCDLSLVVDIR